MCPYICVSRDKKAEFDELPVNTGEKLDVSVVIPTYNEAGNIRRLIDALSGALKGYKFEIVVVDDASKDSTPGIIDSCAGKGIVFAVHRTGIKGIFSAILDGIKVAGGKNVLVMDADFSHPPGKAAELMRYAGNYDVVSGSRFIRGGGINAPLTRTFGTVLFNYAIRFILGFRISDWTGGFHVINRKRFMQIPFKYGADWGEFDLELLFRAVKMGFRIKEVPFHYSFREEGASKSAEGAGFLVGYAWKYGIRALRLRLFG